MHFHTLCRLALLSLFTVFLTACGSGDGGDNVTVHTATLTLSGKPVENANFSSTGGGKDTSGTTTANGQFTYADNSTVKISIGNTLLGSASAASLASGLAMESLISAYTGTDPVIKDLAAILTESDDAATPQITLPSDFAALSPIKTAILTVNGKPVSNVSYSALSGQIAARSTIPKSGVTDSTGKFEFDPLATVTFKIGNTVIGSQTGSTIAAGSTITIESLIAANPAAASDPTLSTLPSRMVLTQGAANTTASYQMPNTLVELDPVLTTTLTFGAKPVEGANFTSTGGAQDTSGTTTANGQFTYTHLSTIAISIGSTPLGTATAASIASGLTIESLIAAYTGDDPVILDLAAILADSDDTSTPQITLPSDFAALNPVQDAILKVNGKPVSNVRYITVANPNATATRNIIEANALSDTSGNFEFDPLTTITFKIGTAIIGELSGSDIPAGGTVTLESLIAANAAAPNNPTLASLANLLMVSQGTPIAPDFYRLPDTLAELNPVAKTILTLGGKPISGVGFSSGGNTGSTNQSGVFAQDSANDVTFTLKGLTLGISEDLTLGTVVDADLPTSIEALAAASTSTNPVIKNLPLLLTDLNAIGASNPIANFRLSDLEQAMFKPDTLPADRLLGMNLETPQAEADGINQPLITADIFRIARPFQEASCEHVVYSPTTGWPIEIPAACSGASTATPESKYAYTQILRYSNNESIPEGTYTVLYDGVGSVHFSGMGCNRRFNPDGVLLVDLDATKQCPHSLDETDRHNLANVRGLEVSVTSIDSVDPIRNIRIIMPGGICKGAPFTRVEDATACGSKPYISFAEVLKANRNAIVFNPDYLNFAKDFRVLRMMNLMEASPRRPQSYGAQNPCPAIPVEPATGASQAVTDAYTADLAAHNINYPTLAAFNAAYDACVLEPLTWAQRPTMNDINWGGSSLTSMRERQGVPLEVGIALANLLKAHPWLIIPHNADDSYISEYATLLANELDESLIAHIEYSNEVWNSGFWGHQYNTLKGAQDSVISGEPNFASRDKDYSNRVRYYAKRATKIFQDFGAEFGDLSRLKRILGGQNKFPAIIGNLLSETTTVNHTDAIAIAPYFHGCWAPTAANTNCGNVDNTISDAQTVDDLFTVMDSQYDTSVADDYLKGDPDSLDGNIKLLAGQIAQLDQVFTNTSRKIDLYAYEGGQHLTIKGTDEALKTRLLPLIEAANRDPRMKERYKTLLNGWKDAGGKLFALFTAPQTFNRYGSFGIKENLNSPRISSPKFDGAMTFQEELNGCWSGYAGSGCP